MDRSVEKRKKYAHLSLVEGLDFILKDRQGDQAIRASTAKGKRKGWDPGPPVWDPGTPSGHMRTQQSTAMIVLEVVERIRHPTEQSGWLVCTQAHSDKYRRQTNWNLPSTGNGRTGNITTSPWSHRHRLCAYIGSSTRPHGIEW